MERTRIVKSKILADALVWLGFEYTKDEQEQYIFIRSPRFDRAWRDLHAMKDAYRR